MSAFPAPQRLAALDGFPGLSGRKPEWLRSIAVAALAYDLPRPPSADELARISDNWRPYRTWTTVLLRNYLEDAQDQ